jgi:hypothetical protein
MRIAGLLLNAAGVLLLWFGGIPYKSHEKLIELGPFRATTEVEKKAEVPPPVGASLVAVGSAMLLAASVRKGSR